jgi:3-phenylpropionate/trans-cinnamate dioxygenase ferredoxin subunit
MQAQKKYKWHKIADNINEFDFAENNLIEIDVAGKTICIAKGKENIFACTNKCPHAGGTICEGFIDPLDNVVCPMHHYKFNLKNGRNVSGEGYYLKIFPVEIKHTGVFIGFDEGGLLSRLK